MVEKYFVVSPGRSGSSLLCSVMADAGMDFGMPVPAEWERDEGALEHPLAMKAAFRLGKRVTGWNRGRKRRKLERFVENTLSAAACFKVIYGYRMVPHAAKLGYRPKIILNVRPFPEWLHSWATLGADSVLYEDARSLYESTLANGLMLLSVHGGVVITHRQLTGFSWAEPLSELTGIPETSLVSSWKRRFNPKKRDAPKHAGFDAELDRLYKAATEQEERLTAATR